MAELKRELGLLDVFCIASGAMISSGIFVLPGLAHAQAGPSVIFSYLLAGLLAGIGILNTAELATAMPRAGGDYYFISRALGPAVGSVAGLLNWFSLSLKSAFAVVGIAAFTRLLIPVDLRLLALLFCILFVGVNLAGTRHVGRLQVLLVIGLLVLMLWYVGAGFGHVRPGNLDPFMPHGWHRTLATAGFVFVAYGGIIQISSVAAEVRQPARTIPLAMLLSLAVVVVLYVLMVLVTSGVLPGDQLDRSLTPISDGAAMFMGPVGRGAIVVAAILAFVSTANAGVMAASRYLFALSADGMLPPVLSRLSRSRGVPWASVIATGVLLAGAMLLKLDILVEAASLVLILGFILSCICVIVLRESQVQNYRPSFRAPGYPVVQIIGILGFGLLIFELGVGAFVICAMLFGLGAAAWFLYGRKRASQEYALLHLVQRLTSRELVTGTLETELKDVIRERDDITLDRFDELVARAPVLDLPEQLDAAECFERIGKVLAPTLALDADDIAARLLEREAETSTVLSPFLAIPHIVVPGEHTFALALVRAREGVVFPAVERPVHALFVLAGTRDERHFHLAALANIAQIVQDPDFERRWQDARGDQGIRDVLLLAHRVRRPAPAAGGA